MEGKKGPGERKREVESWLKRLSTNPSEHNNLLDACFQSFVSSGPHTPSCLAHMPQMSLPSRMESPSVAHDA